MGLRQYIARRILFAVPTFIGVTFIIFIVMHSVGDPVTMMLQREVGFQNLGQFTGEQIQELKQFYGLDKPVWQQYFVSLSNTFRGDLGISFSSRRPVMDVILRLLTKWRNTTLKPIPGTPQKRLCKRQGKVSL